MFSDGIVGKEGVGGEADEGDGVMNESDKVLHNSCHHCNDF